MSQATPSPVLIRAEGLALSHPGMAVFKDLSFVLRPGLTLIRGGDGRGKTGLLQILAGLRTPASGTLHRASLAGHWIDLQDEREESVSAAQWLQARRAAFANWDAAVEQRSVDEFGLAEHLHKGLFMLSTGTRRKLGLAAAFACGAQLVLLDTPFAALDARSCQVLTHRLVEMAAEAARTERVWVMADHERPAGLLAQALADTIDLGD